VADVRPYLQHAAVVVAPLRVARGIQNKILEAMAMARPVVAARMCAKAMDVVDGEHLVSAESAADYVEKITDLLDNPSGAARIGQLGRSQVLKSYSWQAHLQKMDQYLTVADQG
jgi:glycosyltransferase involved in cell wall biosynthesis